MRHINALCGLSESMGTSSVWKAVETGDEAKILLTLKECKPWLKQIVNVPNKHGEFLLGAVVTLPQSMPDVVKILLDYGADPNCFVTKQNYEQGPVISFAIRKGDLGITKQLVAAGANIDYSDESRLSAMTDACSIESEAHFTEMFRYLQECEIDIDKPAYGHTALQIVSQYNFVRTQFLIGQGADESLLQWTPLHRAVAFESLDSIKVQLEQAIDLESTDSNGSTALHLAVYRGDFDIVECLVEAGADINAFYRAYNATPLDKATSLENFEIVELLLNRGANAESIHGALKSSVDTSDQRYFDILWEFADEATKNSWLRKSLRYVQEGALAQKLLKLGANPLWLTDSAKRSILGLGEAHGGGFGAITPEQYRAGRSPRYGISNPEESFDPFHLAMFLDGGEPPREYFNDPPVHVDGVADPVWTALRLGQSMTAMPDGRFILIGGEHEDWYDPNFKIYNDVIVHVPGGETRMFLYPRAVFMPTDSHTATLVGNDIVIIGGIGYKSQRRPGFTPVVRLNTETYAMEALETQGNPPGWIYKHSATLKNENQIWVTGGKILSNPSQQDTYNSQTFILDLETLSWSLTDERTSPDLLPPPDEKHGRRRPRSCTQR